MAVGFIHLMWKLNASARRDAEYIEMCAVSLLPLDCYLDKRLVLILILIYLLTAIGLSPGGSSTVHLYTQTIHRTTQLTTLVGRLSGIRTQSGCMIKLFMMNAKKKKLFMSML